jgi:hypothetical protein
LVLQIGGPVHLPHAAGADAFLDPVLADHDI